jgi:hypothetical protein
MSGILHLRSLPGPARPGPAIRLFLLALAVLLSCLSGPAAAQTFTRGEPVTGPMPGGSRPGNPLYDMPPGQTLLSAFGERPVFSPDGRKVAFIGKSYGDAYEMDLATGAIRNLTAHAPHEGFLRVHYLADGSFLLLGPHQPAATREQTRFGRIELFWMDAQASKPPVPLGVTVFEGIATSRRENLVAWTQFKLDPAGKPLNTTVYTARVAMVQGRPTLVDRRERGATSECFVEAQDFLPGDRALTMPCYHFGHGDATDVVSLDFASGKITRYPTTPGLYSEVEGLFPDGRRTLVECANDRTAGMELCVLDLDPVHPRYTRLTHITDYGRWKYGNPVVSPDGRTIAAQVGPADVIDAGVGLGIVLMKLARDF